MQSNSTKPQPSSISRTLQHLQHVRPHALASLRSLRARQSGRIPACRGCCHSCPCCSSVCRSERQPKHGRTARAGRPGVQQPSRLRQVQQRFGSCPRRGEWAVLASSRDSGLSADAHQNDAKPVPISPTDVVEGAKQGKFVWARRWTIIGLCFLAFALCNMDRVNMSIAILPMSKAFGWDSTTVGLVQSSFFWGYLLTQVLGGVWADRLGGKLVLGFGVAWWSLATALTPLAASLGLPTLLFARACMGIGEGVAMPAMNNLLSRWVPVQERSRSLSLVYSGMYTGSMAGLAASPQMVKSLGWPSVFYIFGSLGLVWSFFWQRSATSSPHDDMRMSDAERKYVTENTIAKGSVGRIPWKKILSKGPVWALILSHFCHNWGTFILLTWMPSYYHQVLGMDLMRSGFLSVLPWLTMAISANVAGWVADSMVAKGMSITKVRKIMQTIGFMGPAIFLSQLGRVHTPGAAVACMMASQGLDACSQSGLYSNHQDIGPRYSGVLLGMSNTAGVLAGVIGTAATGYILKNGTWDDVWRSAVILYVVGTVIWNTMASGEQVID
ncbi:hypothetical protein WJX84_006822 [Apatococcus fuscideae]|uniref:Major facilitator superfamily (MFS) profile domain-containing protein n=1 Tax=Apatococcus fuscideae TaxID=2026836 RepID=A0AAW1SPU6_9CHLO